VSRVLQIGAGPVSAASLSPAVRWLAGGGIVAFPTDTLYGLAVDPFSSDAVAALFDLKGRPSTSAIPLVAGSRVAIETWLGRLDDASGALAERFWPGPLSLIVDAPSTIAAAVHAGTHSVAVRVPDHDLARAFAEACGHPITATSANVSGAPPVSTAAALGTIAGDPRVLVIDGGPTPGGPPSTIVDARRGEPIIVRDGAIARDRVLRSGYR
jgi:L-threonylcarbamoyladenylate synthase